MLTQIAREMQRQQRAQARRHAQAAREAERARRAYERAVAAEATERARLYLEWRLAEVEQRSGELETHVERLIELLHDTLHVDDYLDEQEARQHPEVEEFRQAVATGQPDAVVGYFTLVLQASAYPEGVRGHAKLAYLPESSELVVEYNLPPLDVIPDVGAYKYVRARDQIVEMPRPASSRSAPRAPSSGSST